MNATKAIFFAVLQGLCALLFITANTFAQFDTATVLGTVRDSSKLSIAGSSVNLTNTLTGVSVNANVPPPPKPVVPN